MSRTKQWDGRWTPSEGYDSSGTSNSEQEEDEFVNIDFFEQQVHESGNCFCQVVHKKILDYQSFIKNEIRMHIKRKIKITRMIFR